MKTMKYKDGRVINLRTMDGSTLPEKRVSAKVSELIKKIFYDVTTDRIVDIEIKETSEGYSYNIIKYGKYPLRSDLISSYRELVTAQFEAERERDPSLESLTFNITISTHSFNPLGIRRLRRRK